MKKVRLFLKWQKHHAHPEDQTDEHTFNIVYALEPWTFTAGLERRILTTEIECFRRLLVILYKDHITNAEVWNEITKATGPHEDLLPQ